MANTQLPDDIPVLTDPAAQRLNQRQQLDYTNCIACHRRMIVNETLLEMLSGISSNMEYGKVRMINEFSAFTGVDGVVDAIERGAEAEVPEANVEVW